MTFPAHLRALIAKADAGDTAAMDEYQVLVTMNAEALAAVVEAAERLDALKSVKEEIESDASDTVKTLSLQMYYERNKDEAWAHLRTALAALHVGQTGE